MKLPNLEEAFASPEKIKDYLLNLSHDDGRGKAIFFMRFGFSVAKWEMLAEALIRHAYGHDVVKAEVTQFGTRYVVEGFLQTPGGETPQVRVVWFISSGETSPRLVTAYALEVEDD